MSKIPQRKHSKDELATLRTQKAMQMAGQQVVNPYDKKLASKAVIILGYLCALVAPLYLVILKLKDAFIYEMSDLRVMVIGSVLAILIAVFIFVARSLSRHHASFMIIIALISSFSMVYLVNSDSNLKREVMVMFGQEVTPQKSEADRILEDSLKLEVEKSETNGEAVNSTPGRRQLTPEQIREREEANKAFAELEAENARRYDAEQRLKAIEQTGSESE